MQSVNKTMICTDDRKGSTKSEPEALRPVWEGVNVGNKTEATTTLVEEPCGGSVRERLKRHRVEVAGSVWIPDMWGQEDLLKDWIDCAAFDSSLMSSSIMSARASLVVEKGKRSRGARPLRVEKGSC